MKWENDFFGNKKHMILDAIIAYSNKFRDKDASEISLKELTEFIDNFFERQNEINKS